MTATLHRSRPFGLGQADLINSGIKTAGQLFGTLISADAQNYAVRKQTKAAIAVAQISAQSQLDAARIMATSGDEQTRITSQAAIEQARIAAAAQEAVEAERTEQVRIISAAPAATANAVTPSLAPVLLILGIGAVVVWAMKNR